MSNIFSGTIACNILNDPQSGYSTRVCVYVHTHTYTISVKIETKFIQCVNQVNKKMSM